jgi:cyclopropane fatty-acyl-phospholipid synthase-like methyltransferase
MAAGLGLASTGIDASPRAIELAQHKAQARGLSARLLVWDALDLTSLGEQFDTVLDCGLFHVLGDDDRTRFVESLRSAVAPDGRYFMLCFSDRQPGDVGPRRVRREEIRASFADGWRVESIEPATIDTNRGPAAVLAWLASITRT